MTEFFLYARKSSESEDRQALSIDAQIQELGEFARRDGLKIVNTYTEAQSAKRPGRPEFEKMMKAIGKRKGVGVLCWKLDRLTRNMLDAARISDALESGALQVIRTPQQEYRNSSSDLFMSGLEFLMGKKYIDDLSENVKRGMRAKVRDGWFPGAAPIGYVNDPSQGKGAKRIRRDPERFRLVRKLWDLMLTGCYTVNRLLDIATNDLGLRHRAFRKLPSRPMSESGICYMFSNPFYCGQFRYNGELFSGKHEPMVTLSEFRRVQKLLGRTDRERPKRHLFTFTGLIRCGECGAGITAEEKYKHIKGTGERRRYVYYHCSRSKGARCIQPSLREDHLKGQFAAALKRLSFNPAYLDWIDRHLDELAESESLTVEESGRSIDKELSAVTRSLDNLFALKLSPANQDGSLLSDKEFVEQKNRLLVDRTKLEEHKSAREDLVKESTVRAKDVFRFAAYAYETFVSGTRDQQRAVFSGITSNQKITNKSLVFETLRPFEILSRGIEKSGSKSDNIEPTNLGLRYPRTGGKSAPKCVWLPLLVDVRKSVAAILAEDRSFFIPSLLLSNTSQADGTDPN